MTAMPVHIFLYNFLNRDVASQSTLGSSQLSSAIEDPLANPDLNWKDADVEDTGAPDHRNAAFHPERQPGMQLGRFLRLNIGSKYCCCYLHDKNRRDSFFF
jgi:hypothetical protein